MRSIGPLWRAILPACAAAALVALVRTPATADCTTGITAKTVFFVTDREPLRDDQLFSGERGIGKDRRPIVTRGTLTAPVGKSTERRCTSLASFDTALSKQFDAKRGRQALIYVHGFHTSFRAAVEHALTLKAQLHFPGPLIVYSWPAKTTSKLAYLNDETNAAWSMTDFRNLLAGLQKSFPKIALSFATHSLGARFAADGVAFIRHSGCKACFARAALFAPDIDSATPHGELAELGLCSGRPLEQPKASAPVVLYVSNNDLALRQSQRIHGHQRAGQAGNEMMLCNGVDTIDVSAFKGSDRAGHSYQLDPRVLDDARAAFAGVAPNNPQRKLKRVTRDGGVYYELR